MTDAVCRTDYSSGEGFGVVCLKCGERLGYWIIQGDDIPAPCENCFPDEYKRQAGLKRSEAKTANIKALKLGSQLTPRFKTMTLDGYEVYDKAQEKALSVCHEFVENFSVHLESGTWLTMLGGCGTGKGHLAAAICNALIERSQTSCLYQKYYELIRRIKASWNKNATESEGDILSAMRDVDLLVLDEIGVQFNTPAERLILYAVLDHRYEWCRPTIITSNLTLKQLNKVVGERLISRLADKGNLVIGFTWADYRQRK